MLTPHRTRHPYISEAIAAKVRTVKTSVEKYDDTVRIEFPRRGGSRASIPSKFVTLSLYFVPFSSVFYEYEHLQQDNKRPRNRII